MVLPNLFSTSKKSGSSDNSNSSGSVGSISPTGSDKKTPKKSNSKDQTRSPNRIFAGFLSGLTKKDGFSKCNQASPDKLHSPRPIKSNLSSSSSPAETSTLASSLGLPRIKTRSGPLPLESFFNFGDDDKPTPAVWSRDLLTLTRRWDSGLGSGNTKKKEANVDHISHGTVPGRSNIPPMPPLTTGQSKVASPSEYGTPEKPKEQESLDYQALLHMTSAPRKKFSSDIKSFSHELNSKGVRPFPLWKPRRSTSLEEILTLIRSTFDKVKEEVNLDLTEFAEDLITLSEEKGKSHPELELTIGDLLILAQKCCKATSGEFWLQCEGIVEDLDDKRQELPPGVPKQLHTRMLFILTRCTRLLQFHKESWGQEEEAVQQRQSRVLHSADKRVPTGEVRDRKGSTSAKKAYSQEQRRLNWKEDFVDHPSPLSSPYNESPANIDRMSFWKRLPSPASKAVKEAAVSTEKDDSKVEPPKVVVNRVATSDGMAVSKPLDCPPAKLSREHMSKHGHNTSWGYWGVNSNISPERLIICRICEEDIPTIHVEDHSRICALADRYDNRGLDVDARLVNVAVILDKIIENFIQKDSLSLVESPMKISNASSTGESDVLSSQLSDLSRRGSEDMLDFFPEADNLAFMNDMRSLTSLSWRTRFGPKSDQGMTSSSAGSMTPRSPIPTPRPHPIELLLGGKVTFRDRDDIPQMTELADIARCAANAISDDDQCMRLLLSCIEDLRAVVDRRKFDALTVETFGTRIEKLIRDKYLQLNENLDDGKNDLSSTVINEDAPLEDDVVRSLRASPVHMRDRISIDHFEEIKEISRGAFGRVLLARKRTTGDIFAIKVLKKADMIRKNAVESILAERDILISVRNPFVVRFFYSFTSRENLYLVMEYLNGGDLFSMLKSIGCMDETHARVYIAEVVLALEYLHSEGVVHRDLKPDNLLIAHDGHIKLTDFGLSKVGLVNSTDDLSGPVFSGASLPLEEKPKLPTSEHKFETQDRRSAVGTPDYLAPEILLGTTGHGAAADWWAVGIILYEFIVGIPPFNANTPEKIFDNILNRNIRWPTVPEEMSHEAYDLINRLLTEDPYHRLGARGAAEVKQHIFFKDINWSTLAEQKAAFVPDSEDALDTSYFQSRYPSNFSSGSGSSGCVSNDHNEGVDGRGGPAEWETSVYENKPFGNFSFKNLMLLAYINCDVVSKGQKNGTAAILHRR